MYKRSAAEAFPEPALSAFARAKARKPANAVVSVSTTAGTVTTVATDGPVDIIESKPPTLERHETFGFSSASEQPSSVDQVEAEPSTVKPLSFFRARALKMGDGVVTVSLKPEEWLSVSGVYDLVVSKGAVSIYGAYVAPSDAMHRVFAPLTHALPTIRARFETVVELRSADCALESMDTLSPLWNRMWHQWQDYTFAVAPPDSSADSILAQASPLDIGEVAQKVINRLSSPSEQPSKTLVTGAKASGKSTFCRCLANSIVSSARSEGERTCFWLELDPGQPEFGHPGQICLVQIKGLLLGPSASHSYTHSRLQYRTIRSHTLAATSPREDTDHYLECVSDLYQRFLDLKKQFSTASLVIDSPGWITGSGAVLLQRLIKSLNVIDVVVLESPDIVNIDSVDFPPSIKLRTIPAQGRSSPIRPSAEYRAMQTMSYFHTVNPSTLLQAWTAQPLLTTLPLKLSYDGPDSIVHAVASYHTMLSPPILHDVLDGLSVSLVVVAGNTALESYDNAIKRTVEGLPYLLPLDPTAHGAKLDPRHSECIGQALVRRIDTKSKSLHLTTPVTEADIRLALKRSKGGKSKLVLVFGKFDCPDWAFLEHVYHRDTSAKNGEAGAQRSADWDLDEEDMVAPVEGMEETETTAPYVSARPVRNGADLDGDSVGAGEILSERVWRPRHLPRNAR